MSDDEENAPFVSQDSGTLTLTDGWNYFRAVVCDMQTHQPIDLNARLDRLEALITGEPVSYFKLIALARQYWQARGQASRAHEANCAADLIDYLATSGIVPARPEEGG